MSDETAKTKPERIDRAKHIRVRDTAELGALIRLLRLRAGFTQAEAADLLGVGRRWYNDLENGKETIRIGMVFEVLESFNCGLTLSGAGADFTPDELAETAVIKGRETHVWEAEFAPSERTELDDLADDRPGRGHRRGHIRTDALVSRNSVKAL